MYWIQDKKALVWLQFIELVGWANVTHYLWHGSQPHLRSPETSSSPWLFSIEFPVFSKQKRLKNSYWLLDWVLLPSLHREAFLHRPLSMCCMPNLDWQMVFGKGNCSEGNKNILVYKVRLQTKWKSSPAQFWVLLVQRDDPDCVESHTVSSLPLERWA